MARDTGPLVRWGFATAPMVAVACAANEPARSPEPAANIVVPLAATSTAPWSAGGTTSHDAGTDGTVSLAPSSETPSARKASASLHAPQGSSAPTLVQGPVQTTGNLPKEVILRIVRQQFGRFRLCYEKGLKASPTLAGNVITMFTIDSSGTVTSAADIGSDMKSPEVVGCVTATFKGISFPKPEAGNATVFFTITFNPGR